MKRKLFRFIVIPFIVILLLSVTTRTAFAQGSLETVLSPVDTVWVLIAAFLVFFMQAGFGFLEAGFVRSKNVVNIMAENLMDTTATTVGFIIAGFGLMFAAGNDFFGTGWFFLSGLPEVYPGLAIPTLAFFFFQFAFSAAASTIASGLMAERTDFRADLTYSFLTGLLIYPIFGHWVWGGGWLAKLGYLDFAGSSVVHLVGAMIGLAGTLTLGKRQDKEFGKPTIRGHNIPLAAMGTFVLWLGWFGFNPGSQLSAEPRSIALIVVTTDFAATSGAIAAMFISYFHTRKWDISMGMNGCLGGLVAITASCAFVTPMTALLIGAIAGAITYYGVEVMERLRIDDPVGAFPVHGMNGIFGILAVGLWSVDKGLFYGGGLTQLGIQALGALACIAFVFPLALLMFQGIKRTLGLRVKPEVEAAGIDLAYHGVESYPEFTGAGLFSSPPPHPAGPVPPKGMLETGAPLSSPGPAD